MNIKQLAAGVKGRVPHTAIDNVLADDAQRLSRYRADWIYRRSDISRTMAGAVAALTFGAAP